MAETFWLNADGEYVDDEESTLTVETLEHSEYGTIKYITFNSEYIAVNWDGYDILPSDWTEEIV